MELSDKHPIFVGFKLDGTLRHQLDSLTGPDSKYVSHEDQTFLTFCTLGTKRYVGKLLEGPMTTDRVDDVKRNVLSIVSRLCPEVRLPEVLEIWVGLPGGGSEALPEAAVEPPADSRPHPERRY